MREQEAEKYKLKHTYKEAKMEKKNEKTNCSGEGKRGTGEKGRKIWKQWIWRNTGAGGRNKKKNAQLEDQYSDSLESKGKAWLNYYTPYCLQLEDERGRASKEAQGEPSGTDSSSI